MRVKSLSNDTEAQLRKTLESSDVTQAVHEVAGALHVEHFQAALDAVVARYATLR